MESITRFITHKLKLRVNETKSAVTRPRERKFLGFSFTAGPDVRRIITSKALDRFKRRIREITRRAKDTSIQKTIKELASYMRGWRSYSARLPRCWSTSHVGPAAASRRDLAAMENTTPSPGCFDGIRGSTAPGHQHSWERPWPFVPREE
jgi:hypothetical protein